jgi:amino acid transporter
MPERLSAGRSGEILLSPEAIAKKFFMQHTSPMSSVPLKRSLSVAALIIYGVGDILGAGIYALVGKVAGEVGPATWMSFVISLIVAVLTALTYAELGSRIPRSAGAAVYALAAFRRPVLSYLIGFLVLLSGMSSMATVSHAFAGYIQAVIPQAPFFFLILLFFLVLTVINFWGIEQSSFTNIICTAVEVTGILVVIAAGLQFFGHVDYFKITPPSEISPPIALLRGSILAFYAFIGFEDIANVAEETHAPEKAMPQAILTAVFITAAIYILTAIAAVSAVPISELASSSAPLMLVVEKGFPGIPRGLFSLVAIFAVTNTALINYIMGSRLLFGMANEGLVPSIFSRVHPLRRTPHWAIGAVLLVTLTLAFSGTIVILAQATSLSLLCVFFAMNVALIVLKLRSQGPAPVFQIPLLLPVLGALLCLGLIFFVKVQAFVTVAFLLMLGIILFFLQRIRLKS